MCDGSSYIKYHKNSGAVWTGWIGNMGFYIFFPKVFQSRQNNGQGIMKLCVQWNPLQLKRSQAGLESGTARPVGWCLTYWATELVSSRYKCMRAKNNQLNPNLPFVFNGIYIWLWLNIKRVLNINTFHFIDDQQMCSNKLLEP